MSSSFPDNDARALLYFAVGVTSESADRAYQLSFAGHTEVHHGHTMLYPKGNSGYSIGTLQTDLGQHHEVAKPLTDAFQTWARTHHPEWVLSEAQQNQTISDLSRDGKTVVAQGRRPIDATVKSHLDSFMASDAGKTFVHDRDVAQVTKLMTNVVTPLRNTDVFKNASVEDQEKLIAITAKAYNQSEYYGGRILGHIKDGSYHSVADVSSAVNQLPDYMVSGRDGALRGTQLFHDLQHTAQTNPLHGAWEHVKATPLVNPTQLSADPTRPQLPHEYAVVKDAFVDPLHSRPLVHALDDQGSYAVTAGDRGFYAERSDMVVWDRAGEGHAMVGGQWRSVAAADISTHANTDRTLDVNVRQDGREERLLHVTHPGNAQSRPTHGQHGDAASHVQHAGTLREHDHTAQVGEVQASLAALGYHGADGKAITPDNDFGANTKSAVQAFQRAHNLTDDGIVGSKTLDALRAAQHSPSLSDPVHAGNGIYNQALQAVGKLDEAHGRATDQQSRNLAGALAESSHANGMSRIDQVVLSDDGSKAYAVQGELNSPHKQYATVDVANAVRQPLEQSGVNWQQTAPAQAAPEPSQQQQPGMAR